MCVRARGVAVGISTGIFVNGLFWDSPTQASACSCPPFSLSLRVSVCLSLSLFVPPPTYTVCGFALWETVYFPLPPAPSSTLRFFLSSDFVVPLPFSTCWFYFFISSLILSNSFYFSVTADHIYIIFSSALNPELKDY